MALATGFGLEVGLGPRSGERSYRR